MKHPLLRQIANNAPLKVFSVLIAYALWHGLSASREREEKISVPIVFFGEDQEYIVQAPESAEITIRGTKQALASLDRSALAAHVDSARLTPGTQERPLTGSDLLLPQNIKLVHYAPSNIIITKEYSTKEADQKYA